MIGIMGAYPTLPAFFIEEFDNIPKIWRMLEEKGTYHRFFISQTGVVHCISHIKKSYNLILCDVYIYGWHRKLSRTTWTDLQLRLRVINNKLMQCWIIIWVEFVIFSTILCNYVALVFCLEQKCNIMFWL